jgi:hypothetical protein
VCLDVLPGDLRQWMPVRPGGARRVLRVLRRCADIITFRLGQRRSGERGAAGVEEQPVGRALPAGPAGQPATGVIDPLRGRGQVACCRFCRSACLAGFDGGLAGRGGNVDPDRAGVLLDCLRALGGELVGFPEPFNRGRETVQRPSDERVATSPQRRSEAAMAVL